MGKRRREEKERGETEKRRRPEKEETGEYGGGDGKKKTVGLQEALIAFGPAHLCVLCPGPGFRVCCFLFGRLVLNL